MARRPNYGFQKRQKEIKRQKKKAEKAEKKRLRKEADGGEEGAATQEDASGGTDAEPNAQGADVEREE